MNIWEKLNCKNINIEVGLDRQATQIVVEKDS